MATKVVIKQKQIIPSIERDTRYLRVRHLCDDDLAADFIKAWEERPDEVSKAFHKFVQEQVRTLLKKNRRVGRGSFNPRISKCIYDKAFKECEASNTTRTIAKLIQRVLSGYIEGGALVPMKTDKGKFRMNQVGARMYRRPPAKELSKPEYVTPTDSDKRHKLHYEAGDDHEAIEKLITYCGVEKGVFFSWVLDYGTTLLKKESAASPSTKPHTEPA